MYFRSFAPLVIDVIATIFLTVVNVKSLQKFVKDMDAKESAIHSVARKEISIEGAFQDANIAKENAETDQERKRMDNELLRELTRRRNDDTLGGGGSGSKGKYGGGW